MKSGDLVVLNSMYPMMERVAVSWGPGPGSEDSPELLEVSNEGFYPAGTLAVFIRADSSSTPRPNGMSWRAAWIMIDGRIGWVWEEEIAAMPQ
jgi:hypothetical protein